MLYFCSDWGYTSNWKEADLNLDDGKIVNVDRALERFLRAHIEENYRIYDADNCGDEHMEFAVDIDGAISYYDGWYSWWFEDDEEGYGLHDELSVMKVETTKFKFPKNRDWLVLKRFGWKEKWPPKHKGCPSNE